MAFISGLILSIVIACLVVLVVTLVKKRLEYFSSRGLPYSKPTWKLILFSFKHFTDYPTLMYKRERDSGHPIIGYFHTFLQPSLLVLDPSLIKEIYVKQFSHFHDHGIETDFSREPELASLFQLTGDEWRVIRNRLMPAFSHGKLKAMIPDIVNCARSFINKINQDNQRQDVNLKELFKKYSTSAYAKCVCGVEPESLMDPDCEYQRQLRAMFNPTFATQNKCFIILAFPKIAKLFNLKVFPETMSNFYANMTRDTLEMRKKSGVRQNDFIQTLLDLKEEGSIQLDHVDQNEDDGEGEAIRQRSESSSTANRLEITDGLLTAQIIIILAAGFDNTAYNIALTIYLLSKNKFIQHRVREEVKEAKNKYRGLNYGSLKEMKLLDAVMNESLRIYPVNFFQFRRCTKSYTLNNGLKIEKGMQLFIPFKAIQNDGKYWLNPDDFNPDRFLNDNYILPGTYMPFGDGPRICQGYKISPLIVKIILAELVDSFELLPSNKTKEPLKTVILATSEIEGGIWGSLRPLNQQKC